MVTLGTRTQLDAYEVRMKEYMENFNVASYPETVKEGLKALDLFSEFRVFISMNKSYLSKMKGYVVYNVITLYNESYSKVVSLLYNKVAAESELIHYGDILTVNDSINIIVKDLSWVDNVLPKIGTKIPKRESTYQAIISLLENKKSELDLIIDKLNKDATC